MRLITNLAAGALIAALATTAAQAGVTTYSDRAAFNAASSIRVTDTFEHTPTGQSTDYSDGYQGDGYSAKGNGRYLVGVDPEFYPAFYRWGSGDVMLFQNAGTATFNFDDPVHSVGLDLMTIVNFAGEIDFTVDGQTFTISTADFPNRTFFGLTSTTGFRSFTLTSRNGMGVFDNLSFGGLASAVPEPATWAMLIAGFAGTGLMLRRSRQNLPAVA